MCIVSVTVFVMPFFTIKLYWSYFLNNSFGSYFEYKDLGHNYSTRCLVIFIANCYVIHLTGFSFPVSELPAYQNADMMDNLHVYQTWGFSVTLHRSNTSNTVLVINLVVFYNGLTQLNDLKSLAAELFCGKAFFLFEIVRHWQVLKIVQGHSQRTH